MFWHGREGILWDQLMPLLRSLAAHCCPLQVLIVHLGENGLVTATVVSLVLKIKRDVLLIVEVG